MNKPELNFEHCRLQVIRTAHYFVAGSIDAPVQWLVAHGYAMTGDQMIQKFRHIAGHQHRVIAAEALSCFYHGNGASTQPLASWMTSRHRLDEIEDYSRYLNQLNTQNAHARLRILLGFSQGGTTMWRFINNCLPDFDIFINWAGDIPEDTKYNTEFLAGKQLFYIYGDQDQYIDDERVEILKQRCNSGRLPVRFMRFKGGHKVDRQFLEYIVNSIIV